MARASLPWQGLCNPALADPDFLSPPGGQPQGGENGKRHLLYRILPAGRALLKLGPPTPPLYFLTVVKTHTHLNQSIPQHAHPSGFQSHMQYIIFNPRFSMKFPVLGIPFHQGNRTRIPAVKAGTIWCGLVQSSWGRDIVRKNKARVEGMPVHFDQIPSILVKCRARCIKQPGSLKLTVQTRFSYWPWRLRLISFVSV